MREGRDPTLFFAGGNRWDDGTFEVLYTSLSREGAIAGMHYHVARGQPIAPSKIKHRLHELQENIDGVLDLTDRSFFWPVSGSIQRHMVSCPTLSEKGSMKPAKRLVKLLIFWAKRMRLMLQHFWCQMRYMTATT